MTLPSNLLSIPIDGNVVTTGQPGLTWLIDRDSMRIIGQCDNYTAVAQAVDIILNTYRYRWGIYLPSSGTEYDGLIGQNRGYVVTELKRRITEALLMDDRVTGLTNYSYDFQGDTLTVNFTVTTLFGDIKTGVTL